jgi:arginyl-tRNA synthetase
VRLVVRHSLASERSQINLYAGTPGVSGTRHYLLRLQETFNIALLSNQIVATLGSHFDAYIYESEAGVDGKKIVLENTPTVFTESEGAIVYIPDESKKLHTSVFINSQGNPTYEAKDIGLLHLKFETYNPDLSIFITDAQQVSHFDVVLDAAAQINTAWKEKSLHRYHGRMSFKGAKMSSRLGGVPLVEDILETVASEVKEKNADIAPQAAEQIGIAAIKFAILRAAAGKNIDFDPDTSLSFEGDSGPYVQYTAVRAASLIQKGSEAGITPDATTPVSGTELLERIIARYPESRHPSTARMGTTPRRRLSPRSRTGVQQLVWTEQNH